MNPRIIDFLKHSNLIEGVGLEGLPTSIQAFNYLMQIKPPLEKKHLLKAHRLLMKKLNSRIAEKYRDCLVQVDGRLCLPVEEIPHEIKDFFKLINCKKEEFNEEEKENYCKLTHIEFENIHPFEGGNGRIGRLLLNWQRKQLGLPLLIIKYEDRWEYYNWFL